MCRKCLFQRWIVSCPVGLSCCWVVSECLCLKCCDLTSLLMSLFAGDSRPDETPCAGTSVIRRHAKWDFWHGETKRSTWNHIAGSHQVVSVNVVANVTLSFGKCLCVIMSDCCKGVCNVCVWLWVIVARLCVMCVCDYEWLLQGYAVCMRVYDNRVTYLMVS